MLRGILALTVVVVQFLVCDLVQRLVIAPLVRLRPAWRDRVLTGWGRAMAGTVLGLLRWPGGARVDLRARVPARPGVLILMNHQSLMDIPVAYKCLERGVPRVVTRSRYGKGIPLISHMLRLYEHPLVEPGRTSREDLLALAETAAASEWPFLIFPEGHRTRDGAIRPFKRAGLEAILARRQWTVYVVVVDGLRRATRFKDFVRHLSSIRGRVESVGPFSSPEREEELDAFIDEMRDVMVRKLEEIRVGV
ncbi:MAG TPA: lysophospholipid acyltransferase family protein [bacterium]|nr:lysophospholipid acyltransferase family protein [bacterium]